MAVTKFEKPMGTEVQSLSEQIANKTDISFTDGSFSSNNITGAIKIAKMGKLCIVWLNCEATADSDSTVIATVPTGYKPKETTHAVKGNVYIDSSTLRYWPNYLSVNTNGNVSIAYSNRMSTGQRIDGVFAYECA